MDTPQKGKGNPLKKKFWKEIKDGKNSKVEISTGALIDFCSQHLGYYNYKDYTNTNMLVKKYNHSIVKESSQQELKQDIKNYIRKEIKKESLWLSFASSNRLTDHFFHLIEQIKDVNFNQSTSNEAYFYYRNGVIKVSQKERILIAYNQFQGNVWQDQINNRDYTPLVEKPDVIHFETFLKNISGQDEIRYNSLKSIIGYLLHPYKDFAQSKAIILVDENVDDSGRAYGGTGKSLLASALAEITRMVFKDGKRYNSKETFVFDDIRPFHRILYFDDVNKDFAFETFYSMITGPMRVNRKYKDSAEIPAKYSPKLLISSNYMVHGSGGSTDERRRVEFEVANYYSEQHTPKHEFGHNFFQDWDVDEYNVFDNYMMHCVQYYMQNGIILPASINLQENKLKQYTHPDLVYFLDENILKDTEYDKADLLCRFKGYNPQHKNLSPRTFHRWITEWANQRELIAVVRKSNSRNLVKFEIKSS